MSDQHKSKKKKLNQEHSITNFINKKQPEEGDEPLRKKNKIVEDNSDDSLRFFKTREIKPTTSTNAKCSNVVSEFINKPSTKKTQSKKKSKATKSQGDIRRALSKQEKQLYHAITDTCSQNDPYETQLALAISESLKDIQKAEKEESNVKGSFENPFTSTGKIQSINSVLERYGFKSNKVFSDYEIELIMNNKTKRSKYQKFPTLLTNTSEDKRSEMIRMRVDDILNSSLFVELDPLEEQSGHNPLVYSPYLMEVYSIYNTIFKRSSTENMTLSDYYVSELFEPSNVKIGHLLKDWNTIIGRDPSPERKINKDSDDLMESKSSPKALSLNSSCSDIFDGVDDFSIDELVDFQSNDENAKSINDHLHLLHEKLSQSIIMHRENSKGELKMECDNDELEKNDDKKENMVESVDLTQDETSSSDATVDYTYEISKFNEVSKDCNRVVEKTSIQYSQNKKDEVVDLTQNYDIRGSTSGSSKINEEIVKHDFFETEPANIQDHNNMEEVNNLTQNFDLPQSTSNSSKTNNDEDDILDLTQCGNSKILPSEKSSKSSFDENEIISISDEEINYSIQRCQIEEISPTKCTDSNDILEIDNIAEQSLIDIIAYDDIKIDNSVSELLTNFSENYQCINSKRKSRSIRFLENENFNDSIANIMKKYGFMTTPKPSNNKSFSKIQSESDLDKVLNHSIQKLDSNSFEMESNNNSQNDSQEQDPAAMNLSINKSLKNILNSPIVTNVSTVPKTKPRKSLGIMMNDKYELDTESFFNEPYFSSMTPNELKQELYKYGIRPLPVKKAIELLTHIYNQIHPKICIAIEEEVDMNDSRRDMNITDIVADIGMKGDVDEFVFQLDSDGILDDEEYILPKMKRSKISTCLIPLHISFYNMIRSNEIFQKYILEYRPLDLDQIYKHFRKFDLTYQLNDIVQFLDKRCITFKTKEQSYSKKHERKKQKRTQKSQT